MNKGGWGRDPVYPVNLRASAVQTFCVIHREGDGEVECGYREGVNFLTLRVSDRQPMTPSNRTLQGQNCGANAGSLHPVRHDG
jgi:hypothetical protein